MIGREKGYTQEKGFATVYISTDFNAFSLSRFSLGTTAAFVRSSPSG